jgi:hypothetical protein
LEVSAYRHNRLFAGNEEPVKTKKARAVLQIHEVKMTTEINDHLADKLEFYESSFDALGTALDAVLEYDGDYRALVLRRIGLRWATWEHLIIAMKGIPLPENRTAGDVLQDTLDQLSDEGLISMSKAGISRKYILTERGRSFLSRSKE